MWPTIGFSSTSAPKRNSDAITSICVDSEDEDDGDQPKPCMFFFLFTSQIKFWFTGATAKKQHVTFGATSQRKHTITSDEDASGEDDVDDSERSTTGT